MLNSLLFVPVWFLYSSESRTSLDPYPLHGLEPKNRNILKNSTLNSQGGGRVISSFMEPVQFIEVQNKKIFFVTYSLYSMMIQDFSVYRSSLKFNTTRGQPLMRLHKRQCIFVP